MIGWHDKYPPVGPIPSLSVSIYKLFCRHHCRETVYTVSITTINIFQVERLCDNRYEFRNCEMFFRKLVYFVNCKRASRSPIHYWNWCSHWSTRRQSLSSTTFVIPPNFNTKIDSRTSFVCPNPTVKNQRFVPLRKSSYEIETVGQ